MFLNAHCSFSQYSWQCARALQRQHKPKSTNKLPTSLWPSDLFSQTWSTLHRGALLRSVSVCSMDVARGDYASDSGRYGDCCLLSPLLQAARTQWKPWAITSSGARYHYSVNSEILCLGAKQWLLQSWNQWLLALVWGSLLCGGCTNSAKAGSSSSEMPPW